MPLNGARAKKFLECDAAAAARCNSSPAPLSGTKHFSGGARAPILSGSRGNPMPVEALGYVRARAKSLEDWAGYGPGLLGLQRVDRSRTSLAFRMDDRKQRIIVEA